MAIAFVQYDDQHLLSEGSTIANNTALNTTSGNFIAVIICTWDITSNDSVVTGVADTASNTYIKALGVYRTGTTNERAEIWYAENITGNASNITTATFTRATSDRYISVAEFSGVATSSSLDDTASQANSSVTAHSSSNATASVADTLIVGGGSHSTSENFTVGSGFSTLTSDMTNEFNFAEYKILAGAADYALTYTTNISNSSIVGGAIFKPIAGQAWKAAAGAQINIGDAWKTISAMQINIGDAWKAITVTDLQIVK